MNENFLKSLIIYHDENIIVINKPFGIATHKGSGDADYIDRYLPSLKFNYDEIPMLAHRLDKDTSGCLILGRSKQAIRRLGKLFIYKRISKIYWAIVHGHDIPPEGIIDIAIGKKDGLKYHWHMEPKENGLNTITEYKVLKQIDKMIINNNKNSYPYGKESTDSIKLSINNPVSLLELKPLTGRTHQIRVHCQAIGHPIIGDKIYGQKSQNECDIKMQLHAKEVIIPFYRGQEPLKIKAPLPEHMKDMLI